VTNAKTLTDDQIKSLASNAAQAGDLLQHAICQLALGCAEYSDAGWLNDNTCLDLDERRQLERMTRDGALADVVRAISDGEAQS
jgi:hypothetical protein